MVAKYPTVCQRSRTVGTNMKIFEIDKTKKPLEEVELYGKQSVLGLSKDLSKKFQSPTWSEYVQQIFAQLGKKIILILKKLL